MKRRIAIVEDEAALRENFRDSLQRHGYAVELYPNRAKALAAFNQRLPELVIIDIGLQDEPEGGFDLCRELRAMAPRLPIIFLTARDSEIDIVSGLRLGADDYLTKEISLEHLAARVIALFRRIDAFAEQASHDTTLQRGKLTLNPERMTVHWDGAPIELTVTEFWMVHSLARHPGHVKTRQQLMDAANVVFDDHTITSHIKRIRKKFQTVDPEFDAIQTAYGAGYRWNAQIA